MSITKGPDITKLGINNYPQWSGEMKAWLRAVQLWRHVSGDQKRPEKPKTITETYTDKDEQ